MALPTVPITLPPDLQLLLQNGLARLETLRGVMNPSNANAVTSPDLPVSLAPWPAAQPLVGKPVQPDSGIRQPKSMTAAEIALVAALGYFAYGILRNR